MYSGLSEIKTSGDGNDAGSHDGAGSARSSLAESLRDEQMPLFRDERAAHEVFSYKCATRQRRRSRGCGRR